MKFVTLRLCVLFTLPLVLHMASSAQAAKRCVADESTAYETAFCELKALKLGANLPTLAEFRRNPPAMQYLLLKRKAQRQGIALARPETLSSEKKPTVEGPNSTVKRAPTSTPSPTLASRVSRSNSRHCHYSPERIDCSGSVFVLQGNKANRQLASGVLETGNTLQLGPKAGVNEIEWLANAYERYLRAMLSIGLAGSSFTYSGFAHTYYEHQAQGTDFSARFAQMFEYLKRDKKQLAVSTRRPNRAPTRDECEQLSTDLLVCNSQSMNLVYLLRK